MPGEVWPRRGEWASLERGGGAVIEWVIRVEGF